MLECIEKEIGENPSIAIIWMHGLGAEANDFADLAQMLALPKDIHYRLILPQAPMLAITINHGHVMPAWYDIDDADFRAREDEQGMQRSAKAIRHFMQREVDRGISHIILGGFSQGGALALYTGLRESIYPIAGIVSLSAYLPFADKLPQEVATHQNKIPIFMAHGTADSVVPITWARQSCQLLQQAHYHVHWSDYPMQHAICEDEFSALSTFISTLAASNTA